MMILSPTCMLSGNSAWISNNSHKPDSLASRAGRSLDTSVASVTVLSHPVHGAPLSRLPAMHTVRLVHSTFANVSGLKVMSVPASGVQSPVSCRSLPWAPEPRTLGAHHHHPCFFQDPRSLCGWRTLGEARGSVSPQSPRHRFGCWSSARSAGGSTSGLATHIDLHRRLAGPGRPRSSSTADYGVVSGMLSGRERSQAYWSRHSSTSCS